MKRLPIGIQTINKIIEDHYIYVDKTKVINKRMKGEYFCFQDQDDLEKFVDFHIKNDFFW